MCGDAASADDVDRLLDGATINMINSDPPYGVAVESRSNNSFVTGGTNLHPVPQEGRKKKRETEVKPTTQKLRAKDRPLVNDNVTDEQFATLLDSWFAHFQRALLPGGSFFIWGGYSNLSSYPFALKRHGLYFSQGIVWNKLAPVLSRKDFLGAFELCFYGWREGAAHRFYGPNNVPDLWEV